MATGNDDVINDSSHSHGNGPLTLRLNPIDTQQAFLAVVYCRQAVI